jgi:isopentenyl-diphosphate delta-isomerase
MCYHHFTKLKWTSTLSRVVLTDSVFTALTAYQGAVVYAVQASNISLDNNTVTNLTSGAGGISWQKVEELRYIRQSGNENRFSREALGELLNWGIPTARCIAEVAKLRELPAYGSFEIIASGGIRSGIDIAKSLALGAGIAASAGQLLRALHENRLEETIETWLNDLRAVLFLTGTPSPGQLGQQHLIYKHRPTLS